MCNSHPQSLNLTSLEPEAIRCLGMRLIHANDPILAVDGTWFSKAKKCTWAIYVYSDQNKKELWTNRGSNPRPPAFEILLQSGRSTTEPIDVLLGDVERKLGLWWNSLYALLGDWDFAQK